MQTEELIFGKSRWNWKEELDRRFPKVPSYKKEKAYNNFLQKIHREYQNHLNIKRDGISDIGFSWFFQVLKMASKRLGEESIFICYLILSAARPWERGEFLLSWKGKREDFNKVNKILYDLKEKFEMKFPSTPVSRAWEKVFYRYQKNELIRGLICGCYAQDYSDFAQRLINNRDYARFLDLLKAGHLVTKREYQRKLRIKSNQLDLFIKYAQEKGILKIINLLKNSVGLFYISQQKNGR